MKFSWNLLSIYFCIFQIHIQVWAADACEKNPTSDIEAVALTGQKAANLSMSAEKFCEYNLQQRYFNNNKDKFKALNITSTSDDNFVSAAVKLIPKTEMSPWSYSLFPAMETRKAAWSGASWSAFPSDSPPTMEFMEKYFSQKDPSSDAKVIVAQNRLNEDKKAITPASDYLGDIKIDGLKHASCVQLVGLNFLSCKKALDTVEKTMKPSRNLGSIMGQSWWSDIYTNPVYQEGIRLATLKVLENVKKNPPDKNSNIFDDLTSSFMSTKQLNAKQAQRAAFAVLGVIANGGTNLYTRIQTVENANDLSQVGKGLSVIAASMGYLDRMKQEKGLGLYSFPPSVKISCDSSKPYHFWLSAALAYQLAESGHDPKSSAAAAFISEKAYHLTRGKGAGAAGSLQAVLTKNTFDPVINVVKMDIAYGASGAFFGVAAQTNKIESANIDVDKALFDNLENAKSEKGMSSSEASSLVKDSPLFAFRKWDTVVEPNNSFNSIKESNSALIE